MDGADGDILLALVPRHPERFGEVARLLIRRGVPFTSYSAILEGDAVEGRVMLVDAMGVLDGFYALADAAFVGGSLVPVGGHNLLEPAMHAVPVLTGPHLHNFRDIVETLSSSGGCILVKDGESLGKALKELIYDKRKKDEMGRANLEAAGRFSGASEKNFSQVLGILR
jgi:3-deoxy-D-manno-octulosonic-acid transferase